MSEIHLDLRQARDLWQCYRVSTMEELPHSLRAGSFLRILTYIPGITDVNQYQKKVIETFKTRKTSDEPKIQWETAYLLPELQSQPQLFVKMRRMPEGYTYANCLDITIERRIADSDDSHMVGFVFSPHGSILAVDVHHFEDDVIVGAVRWDSAGKILLDRGDLARDLQSVQLEKSPDALFTDLTRGIMDIRTPFDFAKVLSES